nr:Glycosyltransferase family 28 N-terminal domain protein [uncultured bacterium]
MAEAKKAEKAKKSEEKKEEPKVPQQQESNPEAEQKEKATAKAGKRSAKAVAEAEEKAVKEERKKEDKPKEAKAKPQQKPPRSKLERRGKNYREKAKLIDREKSYGLQEALKLACQTASAKFDSTVEFHLRLNVDPKQADQNIRGSVVLPAGTGRTVRVAVFCDEANEKKAKAAGADIAGEQEILSALDKEQIEFDTLIAMPSMMVKLAKYARILGPKGLMPNPKSGTVTADVAKAVEQAKAGKIEYRVDGNGIVHVGVGKVSFGEAKLKQNADELISSIKQNKPSSIKGTYVRSVFVTTTMGPSIAVDIAGL